MALATNRKTFAKGGGRFVVSEGVAPAEALTAHPEYATLSTDPVDDRFEIIITRGTILSVVRDLNGDSKLVKANGTGSNETVDDAATPGTVTVPSRSTVIGVAQYDLYRPFEKGDSQTAGWITHGYVEYPIISGLNNALEVGDLVRSDNIGRPVRATTAEISDNPQTLVGKVVAIEKFATNFDDGMLQYMQLPTDPGALRELFELTADGPHKGLFGVRANLDVADVLGAFRMILCI